MWWICLRLVVMWGWFGWFVKCVLDFRMVRLVLCSFSGRCWFFLLMWVLIVWLLFLFLFVVLVFLVLFLIWVNICLFGCWWFWLFMFCMFMCFSRLDSVIWLRKRIWLIGCVGCLVCSLLLDFVGYFLWVRVVWFVIWVFIWFLRV